MYCMYVCIFKLTNVTKYLNNILQPNVEALEKKVEELCKQYHDAKIKARAGSENNTPHSGSPSSPGQKISGGTHNAWGGFIR